MTEHALTRACSRLTPLLGMEPPELTLGAERTLSDRLWIWGVLGGKEVGKSTLINTIVGATIVDAGNDGGEGTRIATVHAHDDDIDDARARLAAHHGPDAVHLAGGSRVRHLALVDLPDFDSSYRDHAALVHDLAPSLDGIIWVTTPKKIADVRAVEEIRRLLQSRHNFVYVVNKGDWLIERTGEVESLDRLRRQLRRQAEAAGETEPDARAFVISAKGTTGAGADLLESDLARLRALLTSPPENASSRKERNVEQANRLMAARILEHYGVEDARRRLDLAIDRIDDASTRALSAAFAGRLLHRLIDDRAASDEWTSDLFRARIGHWSLVGAIAWPMATLGRLLARLRATQPDPFRVDALDLRSRIEQICQAMQAPLAPVLERIDLDPPEPELLEHQFRADSIEAASLLRAQAFERVRGRGPTVVGRFIRRVVPLLVLLWFPLLQPLLATGLQLIDDPLSLQTLQRLVESLAPSSVLAGLGASVVILALIAGVVYAGAVRDAGRAVTWLRGSGDAELLESLCTTLSSRIQEPLIAIREELDQVVGMLER